MYFSKISLRKDSYALQQLNPYLQKTGYYYHQRMWDLFSENNPEKKRDFLYRAEVTDRWPCFYVVSATKPCDNKGIWEIKSKEYSPQIKQNESLHFRLRTNPRICRTDENSRKKYYDIVQDAWQKNSEEIKRGEITKIEVVQTAGEEWLNKKAAQNGFRVDTVIVENFRKECFNKKQHVVKFSTLDFVGHLTILDAELFLPALFHGVGSAKGFGCGLLMVRR